MSTIDFNWLFQQSFPNSVCEILHMATLTNSFFCSFCVLTNCEMFMLFTSDFPLLALKFLPCTEWGAIMETAVCFALAAGIIYTNL